MLLLLRLNATVAILRVVFLHRVASPALSLLAFSASVPLPANALLVLALAQFVVAQLVLQQTFVLVPIAAAPPVAVALLADTPCKEYCATLQAAIGPVQLLGNNLYISRTTHDGSDLKWVSIH